MEEIRLQWDLKESLGRWVSQNRTGLKVGFIKGLVVRYQIVGVRVVHFGGIIGHVGQQESAGKAQEGVPQRVGPVVIAVHPLEFEQNFRQKSANGEEDTREDVAEPRRLRRVAVAAHSALVNLKMKMRECR